MLRAVSQMAPPPDRITPSCAGESSFAADSAKRRMTNLAQRARPYALFVVLPNEEEREGADTTNELCS